MNILIVDDTKILRHIIKNLLVEFCGIDKKHIFEADDGESAVREFKRLKPKIVFLDIVMPNQDGIETIKQIIEVNPDAKIIMCTGKGQRHIVAECIKAGAADYIVKPILPKKFVSAVNKIINPNQPTEYDENDAVEDEETNETGENGENSEPTDADKTEIAENTEDTAEKERSETDENESKTEEPKPIENSDDELEDDKFVLGKKK